VTTSESSGSLRRELEAAIHGGRCVYCGREAAPDQPLTREHVIPRAKGGSRKDSRIIVPACAGCNHRRGCRELVLFLLLRPRRITAFLDYLTTLSAESIRQMDVRVFAELYAAVWMLNESIGYGGDWRGRLQRLCTGRTLHRRRYAARRVVGAAGGRIESRRAHREDAGAPTCPIPAVIAHDAGPRLGEPLEKMNSRLLGLLSLAWQASAEEVLREMAHQHERAAAALTPTEGEPVKLEEWRRRPRRRRLRVDRRRGRGRARAA
jgi:hypothetical protein